MNIAPLTNRIIYDSLGVTDDLLSQSTSCECYMTVRVTWVAFDQAAETATVTGIYYQINLAARRFKPMFIADLIIQSRIKRTAPARDSQREMQ
jgi:hypothetical protein